MQDLAQSTPWGQVTYTTVPIATPAAQVAAQGGGSRLLRQLQRKLQEEAQVMVSCQVPSHLVEIGDGPLHDLMLVC